jgi:hypothetical protein
LVKKRGLLKQKVIDEKCVIFKNSNLTVVTKPEKETKKLLFCNGRGVFKA